MEELCNGEGNFVWFKSQISKFCLSIFSIYYCFWNFMTDFQGGEFLWGVD